MDNKNIPASLGIIVIIIIAATIAGYLWKYDESARHNDLPPAAKSELPEKTAPSPAGDKNVYINSKYGFSIKFDDNLTFREFSSGAAFQPKNKPSAIENEVISISVMQRTGDAQDVPFETYVKTAAVHEIQNYKSLASIEKITAKSGIIGYKTTWNVAPIMPIGVRIEASDSVSSPRYYFDSKDSRKDTIQMECTDEFIQTCDEIALTFELK